MMNKYSKGLNLVELMVALALGSFISIGVVQMYASNRTTYRLTDAVSEIQDNARFALDLLKKDVRMAGYTGCVSRNSIPFTNNLNTSNALTYQFQRTLVGYDNYDAAITEVTDTLTGSDPLPKAGTDLFMVSGSFGDSVGITKNNNSAQFFAENTGATTTCADGTSGQSGLCKGDIVMVSDCSKALAFQITNLTATGGGAEINVVHSGAQLVPGNIKASWGGANPPPQYSFGADSEIIRIRTNLYYVAEVDGVSRLMRKAGANAAEIIADNVLDMQISYGIDNDDNFQVDDYVDASAVATPDDWDDVRAMQIELLVASNSENVTQESMTVVFNGAQLPSSDRRYYQVYSSNIAIRNRTP